MPTKLEKPVMVRLRRLLNMLYTPAELAEELGAKQELIKRVTRDLQQTDESGQVLINGAQFRQLYEKQPGQGCGNLINRQNWQDAKAYLIYQEEVQMNSVKTLTCRRTQLRRLLEWAGSRLFPDVKDLRPTFPVFLLSYNANRKNKPISGETARRTCELAQEFFTWCKQEYPGRYSSLPDRWIETLKPSKRRALNSELKHHSFYTLEEVHQLISIPGDELSLKRDRAAVAFLYLSGMRIDAFISLPIECVDLARMAVAQLPAKGVRTKNGKAAETYLLNISELLQVVREWDQLVRAELPASALWYSILENKGQQLSSRGDSNPSRVGNFRRDLKRLCRLAGIAYKSPHKFRHGHAVYAISKARNLEDLKATSQNLMHSSISITDGVYGNLNGESTRQAISRLGSTQQPPQHQAGDLDPLLQALVKLQSNPALLQQVLNS